MVSGNLRKTMRERYDLMTKLRTEVNRKIKAIPEGRIRISRRENGSCYYIIDSSTDQRGRYLKNSEKETAEKVMQRSYLEKVSRACDQELKSLIHALESYPDTTAEEVYGILPEDRQQLIKPIVLPDEKFIEKWLAVPFTPKEFDRNAPYFETSRGERVRSKSEVIIADRLAANNIPYKYECPLKVGKEILHPDFTILRLSDRQEIYYEHLGMMDDEVYANRNIGKLNKYSNNGFLPGKRLFTTFETSKVPLDVRIVDKLINEVFR